MTGLESLHREAVRARAALEVALESVIRIEMALADGVVAERLGGSVDPEEPIIETMGQTDG